MKLLYLKSTFFTFTMAFSLCSMLQAQSSTAYFSLDACNAIMNTGDHMDYSEFTAQINNSTCANLSIVGNHLYRINPAVNKHSCTPGVNGLPAMCIGSNLSCTYAPGAEESLHIDVMVTPGQGENSTLSELSFYEQAPPVYDWINGASGPNNYPTLFGIRILKNGSVIYQSADIATQLTWNLRTFNFGSDPEFTVSEPTVFNIELLPYCPVGNGEPVTAWDLDEIRVIATCCEEPNGGTLSGGPFEFCVGDGIPDHATGVVLTGQTGSNNQWVITDEAHNILNLPATLEEVNFDGAGSGICLIYNISYEAGLTGLVVGNNLLTSLSGCFGLSNALSVIRNDPEGGSLSGGPFEFCIGDTLTDVTSIVLSGNAGPNSQFIVTDNGNNILSLPGSLQDVEFSGGGSSFFIYSISFFDPLTGLVVGNNLSSVTGCFGLSNAISVTFMDPDGGVLSGGPFEFCVGDSIPDHVTGVVLTGNVGSTSQWVVTNESNVILSLPASIDSVNFDGGGPGICLIWNVSYFGSITGLVPGNNLLTDLAGCFDLSNSITVIRNQPTGGILSGGPFEFCAGDSLMDVTSILLAGNVGQISQFVVTDGSNIIVSMPGSLGEIDFTTGAPGTFFIYNISYYDPLTGFIIGNNLVTGVTGCLSLSNPITVVINQPDGGTLTGGPFEFCVGDSIPDYVTGVVLTGNAGDNSQWVITNDSNVILSLPTSLDSVNFDGGGQGICLIWNVSYFDTLSGLVPGNNLITDLVGCFDLSNSITVIRNEPAGGLLFGGPFEFCAGDTLMDFNTIVLSGNLGETSQFVVTNDVNVIVGLPETLDEIDLTGSGAGTFFIYSISFFDTLTGLSLDNNLFDVTGCLSISNSIPVIIYQPDGGVLSGGPFEFCVGDGIPDHVSGVVLSGNVGEVSQWVVTNEQNVILSTPASIDSVNFDGGGPGICLIWNVSSYFMVGGLVPGNNLLTDLTGCFDLSNSITVVRNQPEGGDLTGGPFEFCVGDSIADFLTGIELLNNVGDLSQWVLTDANDIIIGLPGTLDTIDFNGSAPGTIFIYNISYFDTLTGFNLDSNLLLDVAGCFDLSDPVTVTLNQPDGGELTGGPFEFCVGDSIPDHVSGVELLGAVGSNSQYVVTDSAYNILSLPLSPEEVNFDNAPPGTCLIVHVSYYGVLTGLEPDSNLLTDLVGCFDLSNAITVVRLDCEGLQDEDPVFNLRISPNPVRDIMVLKMLYNGDDLPLVQLFDASGRLCFEEQHDMKSDMQMNVGHLSEGMYFIRVHSSHGIKTESVVLIK